jgi:hypothetical protein
VVDLYEGLPTEVESAIAQLVMAGVHNVPYWPTQVMSQVHIPGHVGIGYNVDELREAGLHEVEIRDVLP